MPTAVPGLAPFAACTEGIPNSSRKSTGSCDLLWRLWIIQLSAAPRWRWVGVGDSLQACQRWAKDAVAACSVRHTSRHVQTRTWGRITKRSARLFGAVRSPGRGTEACTVISLHASTLMCVSSNYLLAPAPRIKITSPSKQLIKRRKSRSDWFSLNCRSKSSSKFSLTRKNPPFF